MARVFMRKGMWWLDYWANGRRIRESTKSTNRKVAERCLASRMGEVVQGRFKLEKSQKSPHFSSFAETYLEWAKENKKSVRRDRTSIKHLTVAFGNRRLSDIHPFHLESYKIRRKSEKTPKGGIVKPGTINREIACIKRMLNLAVQWGMLQHNLIMEVKLFREPKGSVRFLSDDEASQLIEACSTPIRPVVVTALNTGMRLSEILYLKWTRVNLKDKFISVVETKNNEARVVPLNQTMIALLSQIERKNEYVFGSSRGEPYHCIKWPFSRALRKAGITNFRFHDLRHTWASHLVMSGVDLLTVKEVGGWKSLQMVQRYAHLSDSHRQHALELLDRRFHQQHGTKPDTRAKILEMAAGAK